MFNSATFINNIINGLPKDIDFVVVFNMRCSHTLYNKIRNKYIGDPVKFIYCKNDNINLIIQIFINYEYLNNY